MKSNFVHVWRFTLVNRFTLEQIPEVFALGSSLHAAEVHLRELFSSALYDIDDCVQVQNCKTVIVGMSNFNSLI